MCHREAVRFGHSESHDRRWNFNLDVSLCARLITCYIYLFTTWSRVFLETLIGSQLAKKFPAFYGTWRYITAITRTRHLSLSWARSIQSVPSHRTSWRSILIWSCHLRLGLPSGLFSSGFPTKTLYTPPISSIVLHVPPDSLFSIWSPEKYWVRIIDHLALPYVLFFTSSLPRPS